jgi:hypothetical protein
MKTRGITAPRQTSGSWSREKAKAVNDVLVRAGDQAFARIDIVAHHGELVNGSYRYDAAHQARLRQLG